MAIELNADLAKFNAFVSELGREDSTSVQLEEDHATLGVATKTAGRLSRAISPFKSTSEARTENNRVRAAFLKAVTFQFGGRLANIPKPVMDALRIKDYELDVSPDGNVGIKSGKPLTARRIAQVLAAVKTELGMVPATGENRLAVATQRFTNRIMGLFAHAEKPSIKAQAQKFQATFGTTRAEVEANVRAKLLNNGYVMDFINLKKPTDTFKANLKARHDAIVKEHFEHGLKGPENEGFDWEMVRTATPQRADVIKVNGKSIRQGNLEEGIDGLDAIKEGFKAKKDWDQSDVSDPSKNPSSLSLCAVLKKLIPNTAILKCVTSQLGLQGASGSLGLLGPKAGGEFPLDPGNGHDLRNLTMDAPGSGLIATVFTNDANVYGSVDISVKDGKVTLTQRFQVGMGINTLIEGKGKDMQMLPLAANASSGLAKDVFLPLFTAISTIEIPLDQDLRHDQLPAYTTDLQIDNTIPALVTEA